MRRTVNRQVLEERAARTIEERRLISEQNALTNEHIAGTFEIIEEDEDEAKAFIDRLIVKLLEWMIVFFGGKIQFNTIARKATGMNDRELSFYGFDPELCPAEEGVKKVKTRRPGKRNLGSYYAYSNVVWKVSTPEVKRSRDIFNHMRNYMKSVMGTIAWEEIQIEALGLTTKKFVTHFDKYKDLGIVLGSKNIAEYEAEYVQKAKELSECKLAPRNNGFIPYFFEQALPWNKNVQLEEMTRGIEISKKTSDEISRYAAYNYQRCSDGYWFDDDETYCSSLKRELGIA